MKWGRRYRARLRAALRAALGAWRSEKAWPDHETLRIWICVHKKALSNGDEKLAQAIAEDARKIALRSSRERLGIV